MKPVSSYWLAILPLHNFELCNNMIKKQWSALIFTLLTSLSLHANSLNQTDAASGVKAILEQSAQMAINQLGKTGGFSNNQEVRIELPNKLASTSKMLKMLGLGEQLTQLENSMNQAAELAVPEAKQMLLNSISKMSFNDAKTIVTGGDHAATEFLEKTNRTQLFNKFLPKVKTITDKTALSAQYNTIIEKASMLGVADKNLTIEHYVTNQALDGLFKVMGDKESYLRNNPKEAASSLIKKVFESL